ncbi:MAG TPA: insulinase family protein [Bacteroidales bacterium]|nr:insulinase family protein [Bacteroidales bacterium]
MRKLKALLLCVFAVLCLSTYSYGQKSTFNPNDSIPVDPNVVIGKLDNGLAYYIRKNKKPENRVELRLAINAGSVLENNSQRGLAHFTEHMCFNGTKTFSGNKMIDYLQKYGVSFGKEINAYTAFDQTVYMLTIPVDNKNLLDTGMQIIEDWAHNVSFENKEIDKERGIITEEWRLGLGADDRMMKKWFPVVFKNSLYAERLPIGDIDVIKTFPYDTLKAFYNSWYRPDLQAVVVVGDIDVKEMEAKVKQHFSGIQNPVNPRPRPNVEIPDNKEPLISIVTDKEATNSMILMVYKHKSKVNYTLEDFKTMLTANLFNEMLSARLKEITVQPDAPFIMAQSEYSNFLARSTDAYQLYAYPKENQIEKSFETLLLENQRVRQFGFTPTEFERTKEQMLNDYEKASKEFDKTESENYAGEYVENFLSKTAIPGAKNEFKLAKKLLPEIALEDVNALAAKWITDENMAVVVTAPEKDGNKMPSEKDLTDIIASSKKAVLTAYIDKFKAEPLVKEDLTGSKVVAKKENKDLGFTELTFGNGVKAIIKKTDFKNDEILVSAYSLGGLSLYPDQDYISAFFASSIINESGIGNFDNTELEKKLKGKDIEIAPYIEDLKEGLQGKCSPKDFETLLQLSYLYCKEPRKDTAAFESFMQKMKTQLKFIGSSPIYAFIDTLIITSTGNSPRSIVIPKEKQLNQVNLDMAYKIYKERFSNANDFKFFIVGNIDADSITPVLEKYLGSLPGKAKPENWLDKNPKFPEGITDLEIKKGADPKSMVGIILNEKFEWNDKNRICLRMAKEIISIKLIEVIREEMSGVYSPQIQMDFAQYPTAEYTMMVMFGCSPKNTNKLTKAVFKIIQDIRDKGPQEVDLNKTKEALVREREVDLKTNKFWLGRLESFYFNNDDAALITDYTNKVNAITAKDIQDLAVKYFLKDHYVRVVLKPEKKK